LRLLSRIKAAKSEVSPESAIQLANRSLSCADA
jgi:hypothetical protein